MDILSFLLGRITADGSGGGGGSEAVLIDKTISANGVYNASDDNADGYKKVIANVPNSYSAGDEGKVVSNGALVSQTSRNITANGTYDTTTNDEVVVNVSGGGASLPFALLDTITIPEDTRAVNIDLSNYSNHEIVIIEADFELTAPDYLYVVKNGDSPTGGYYSNEKTVFKGLMAVAGHWSNSNSGVRLCSVSSNTTMQTSSGFPANLYLYTYTASKSIKAGGKINIYGYDL